MAAERVGRLPRWLVATGWIVGCPVAFSLLIFGAIASRSFVLILLFPLVIYLMPVALGVLLLVLPRERSPFTLSSAGGCLLVVSMAWLAQDLWDGETWIYWTPAAFVACAGVGFIQRPLPDVRAWTLWSIALVQSFWFNAGLYFVANME